MSRHSYATEEGACVNPASFTAVGNTTTTTVLWAADIWTPIKANTVSPGTYIEVRAGGISSSAAGVSGALTFSMLWGTTTGGVSLGAGSAINIANAAVTNLPWDLRFGFTVRSIGATGVGTGNGVAFRPRSATTTAIQLVGGTIATIDTTTDQGLVGVVNWTTANSSNTITTQWVEMRTYN